MLHIGSAREIKSTKMYYLSLTLTFTNNLVDASVNVSKKRVRQIEPNCRFSQSRNKLNCKPSYFTNQKLN